MSREPRGPFDDDSGFSNKTPPTAAVDDLKDRVSQAASKVKDKAGEMAETMSATLDQQLESAAGSLDRAASTMHDKAESIPGGPKVADLTHNLADGMQSTASYLREHDFNQMGKDVMNFCRRYPTQSLIAALAVGFLIGQSRHRD